MIAIISKNTRAAHAARWQMECAGEEGKPTLGVHKWVDAKGKVPSELAGCKIIDWTWEGIGAFLDGSDESGSLGSTTLSVDRNAVQALIVVLARYLDAGLRESVVFHIDIAYAPCFSR